MNRTSRTPQLDDAAGYAVSFQDDLDAIVFLFKSWRRIDDKNIASDIPCAAGNRLG